MRIAVIGAGASGICAAIRFRQYIPNLELVVYEQMDGVGGTWYANTYPGVACDVASHAVRSITAFAYSLLMRLYFYASINFRSSRR